MKRIIIVCLMVQSYIVSLSLNPLSHGLAVSDAQKGDWLHANQRMNRLLATSYDDPLVLYDAGVAAYKMKQYDHAYTYFDDCCQKSLHNPEIQEPSYFNKGNSCVELNRLEDAIRAYESVLTLNPRNEAAQHNLNKVKEMLEQQKQQQTDQQKDEKDHKREKESDQQSGSDDHNKSDSSKGSQSNEKNNKEEMSNDSQQAKKNGQDRPHSGDNNNGGESPSQEPKKNDPQKKGSDQKKDAHNESDASQNGESGDRRNQEVPERGNKRNSGSDKEKQKKQNEDGQDQEEASASDGTKPEDQEKTAITNTSNKTQAQSLGNRNEQASLAAQQKNDDLFDKQRAWMAHLLEDQENADQNANKKMVKTAIRSTVADNNGYNCW